MITSIPSNAHMRKSVVTKKSNAHMRDKPMCPREEPLPPFSEPTHDKYVQN